MNAIHTERRGSCIIQIVPDDSGCMDLDDLRGDEEGCGIFLYADFGRYGSASTPTCAKWTRDEAREQQESMRKTHWMWPVYAYIHSGVTISLGRFNCPWDSGCCGFIAIDKKQCRLSKKAYKLAESCVKSTDLILTGEVYGYVISEADEDGEPGEELDSCWGYVGEYDSYVLDEARLIADGHTVDMANEIIERKLWEARGVITTGVSNGYLS